MKLKFITLVFLSGALFVRGQGAFVWDQGSTKITDQLSALTNTPLGQGFTPTMSSMDAAAFNLSVGYLGTSGDVVIDVRSGSVTGAIIGTSNPQTVVGGNGSVYFFTFSSPVTLTPGAQYYLEPVEISGNNLWAWLGFAPPGTGQAICGGYVDHADNFYFEEGTIVPEPSIAALFMIGGDIVYWHRRKRRLT